MWREFGRSVFGDFNLQGDWLGGGGVASKISKGDMEFNGMVNFKKQEFKRLKQEWQMGNGLQAGIGGKRYFELI